MTGAVLTLKSLGWLVVQVCRVQNLFRWASTSMVNYLLSLRLLEGKYWLLMAVLPSYIFQVLCAA